MIFAFNTAIVPRWELPDAPRRAKELGYDALEVHLPNAAGENPAAGTILAERDLVKLVFEQAGVQLSGLSANIRFDDQGRGDGPAADSLRRVIDLAGRLRCPRVRILDTTVRPGRNQANAALRLAEKLVPLADQAADAGTTLLVQNALTFHTSPAMWRLLEQADHPAVACAWDPLAAAVAGEDVTVSVPTLNSRIRHIVLRDATMTGQPPTRQLASLRRIGEGELDLGKLITRLLGIGFAGPVTVTYPANLPAEVGPVEELLKQAAEQLQKWKPAPPKPAAGAKKAGGKTAA